MEEQAQSLIDKTSKHLPLHFFVCFVFVDTVFLCTGQLMSAVTFICFDLIYFNIYSAWVDPIGMTNLFQRRPRPGKTGQQQIEKKLHISTDNMIKYLNVNKQITKNKFMLWILPKCSSKKLSPLILCLCCNVQFMLLAIRTTTVASLCCFSYLISLWASAESLSSQACLLIWHKPLCGMLKLLFIKYVVYVSDYKPLSTYKFQVANFVNVVFPNTVVLRDVCRTTIQAVTFFEAR